MILLTTSLFQLNSLVDISLLIYYNLTNEYLYFLHIDNLFSNKCLETVIYKKTISLSFDKLSMLVHIFSFVVQKQSGSFIAFLLVDHLAIKCIMFIIIRFFGLLNNKLSAIIGAFIKVPSKIRQSAYLL